MVMIPEISNILSRHLESFLDMANARLGWSPQGDRAPWYQGDNISMFTKFEDKLCSVKVGAFDIQKNSFTERMADRRLNAKLPVDRICPHAGTINNQLRLYRKRQFCEFIFYI
jgi:hypothetical protein